MKERFDWLKDMSVNSGNRDAYPAPEPAVKEARAGIASEEEKKRKDPALDREAWLEKWMEDVKQFIRNIDVNSL